MAMSGQDWLNYFAPKEKERKAGWLDTATGIAGGGLGLLLGGPAGAVAGYGIGKSVGDVGENAVNGALTPGNVTADALGAMGPTQALGGAMQEAQTRDLLRKLAASGFPLGMATGGVVPPPEVLQMLMRQQQPEDPYASLTAADIAGPRPTPQPLAQASHPGWEAVSAILGDVLSKLPPPRATKSSNKTIGAFAPAIGAAVAGPGAYAAKQREAKNAPIRKANAATEEDYRRSLGDAGRLLWQHRLSLAEKRALAAEKPQGVTPVGSQTYHVTPVEATKIGRPDWADKDVPLAAVEQARRLSTPPHMPSTSGANYEQKVKQAKEIARRVKLGYTDPNMTSFRDMKPFVEAQLGDFNTAQAVLAYEATKTFVKQRESRLTQQQRNSMNAVQKQFSLLDGFNERYSDQAAGLRSSMQKPNASVLWFAENGFLGPEAAKVSRNLKGQTVLMADQIANIFMAGGVPTDQALKMAQQVLHADWSEDQIASNSAMVKADIAGRLAALREARPMVDTGNYMPGAVRADSTKAAEKEFSW